MTAGCLEIIRSPPENGKQKPVQKREILAERQMNQGGFVDFSITVRFYSQLISSEDVVVVCGRNRTVFFPFNKPDKAAGLEAQFESEFIANSS